MMMPSVGGYFDIFDNFFDDPFFTERTSHKLTEVMKTDIREKDGNYIMDIDMPGLNKEDIKIELNDGYLTVSCNSNKEVNDSNEEEGYIHKERYTGSYSRSYFVGKDLKEDDIKAKFTNGILALTFPKENKKVETKKLIQIQ